MANTKTNQTEKTKNTARAALDERRPYTLHRPEGDRSDFDTVTLNGKTYQIEYGKTVMLPIPVIRILEESLRNRMLAENNAMSAAETMAEKMRVI